MFTTGQIQSSFKKLNLKLVETEDGPRRMAECIFVVEPFPAALAREINPELERHLFSHDAVRGDILDLTYPVGTRLYRLDLHAVPDSDVAAVKLEPVSAAPLKIRVIIYLPDLRPGGQNADSR